MIGCRDNDALGGVFLEELEERVQDSTDLPHVVLRGAVAAERIDLIEQVDAARLSESVEDEP